MNRSLLRNIIVILAVSTPAVSNSTAANSDPELAAIRATAEAYISASPERLRNAFLPSMSLFTTDDKEASRVIPFAEYLRRVSANTASKDEKGAMQKSPSADSFTIRTSPSRKSLCITSCRMTVAN